MRLLYWTETYWPLVGGVQNYAGQFIPAVRKLGCEVIVITVRLNDLPEAEVLHGVPVYRLPFHDVLRGRDPEAFIRLRKRVEMIRNDFQPDLVHLNLYGPSAAIHAETNKRAPIPTVIALHQELTGIDSFGGILQRLFDQASWVTTVSSAALDDLTATFPQLAKKSSFIHNGLATGEFRPVRRAAGAPQVLCVGRLVKSKGIDIAIEAFARVQGRFPDTQLVIVGDGPERPALERQARKLGCAESVVFTGSVEPLEARRLIGQSTAVLVPSRSHESFGLVALEAALMDRPVIASRLGGLTEIIADGATGFLVEQDNPEECARRLAEILGQPVLAARLGAAAGARARKCFSIEANAAAYDALYRHILGGY